MRRILSEVLPPSQQEEMRGVGRMETVGTLKIHRGRLRQDLMMDPMWKSRERETFEEISQVFTWELLWIENKCKVKGTSSRRRPGGSWVESCEHIPGLVLRVEVSLELPRFQSSPSRVSQVYGQMPSLPHLEGNNNSSFLIF